MIKNLGGVFGRNPTFNNVEVEGDLTVDGSIIGTVAAGGSNTQVQFNNAGVLDANAGLTYDSATETLRVRSHPTRYLTIGPDGVGASAISTYGNRALALNSSDYNVEISATNGNVSIDSPEVTITGNMGVGGVITGTDTTASTSSTTGAVIVAGGVGIAKDSHINSQRIGVGLLADTTNLAVGANALAATITGGVNNTAIGSGCGSGITSGSQNTLLGYAVGTLVTTGAGNCSIGFASLNQNVSGSYNTAMGYGALEKTTVGNNTAVGLQALGNLTTGSLNVGIGREAGNFHANGATALTTAGSSVYIGYNSKGLNNSDSNSIVIGALAVGIGANKTVIGTSSTTETKLFGQLTLDATACISAGSATALALKTVVPAGTGVTPTVQIICPSAAYTLTNGTGAQAVFNTGMRTITLQAATTYMFEGQYLLQTGATSHSTSMSFVLTTATITNITWFVLATAGNGAGSLATAQTTTFYNSSGGGAVIGSSTNSHTLIKFEGVLRVNVGGTVVPNIAFSVAPGVTCSTLIGSYIKFYPIGANTINSVGTAIG